MRRRRHAVDTLMVKVDTTRTVRASNRKKLTEGSAVCLSVNSWPAEPESQEQLITKLRQGRCDLTILRNLGSFCFWKCPFFCLTVLSFYLCHVVLYTSSQKVMFRFGGSGPELVYYTEQSSSHKLINWWIAYDNILMFKNITTI